MKRKSFLFGTVGAVGAASLSANAFARNDVWALRCMSPQSGLHWLEGHPLRGTAGLGRERDLAGAATAWEVYRDQAHVVLLRCLADEEGSHWLDGRTLDATVGLAPVTTGIYTGTRWQVVSTTRDTISLRCLGIREGPRWLRGKPSSGELELVETLDPYDGATTWQVVHVDSQRQSPPRPTRGVRVVIVEGTRAWTRTGIVLSPGQLVTVVASGGVSFSAGSPPISPAGDRETCYAAFNGPHGWRLHPYLANDLSCNSLLGRIGEGGRIFEIGSARTFRSAAPGELYLGVNDNFFPDNSGSWTVRITVIGGGNVS